MKDNLERLKELDIEAIEEGASIKSNLAIIPASY